MIKFKKIFNNNSDLKESQYKRFFARANQRISILLKIFYLLLSLILLKLLYIIFTSYYNKPYTPNINNPSSTTFLRKNITDRNNNSIAITIPSVSISLKPNEIEDKEKAKEAIIKVFGMKESQAEKIISSNKSFVWLKRNISIKKEIEFRRYGLIGFYFQKEYKRYYPYSNLFSHIIGFTNIDGEGISGLEYSQNNQLRDQEVQLSLDLRLQTLLHDNLESSLINNKSEKAFGMIVDAKTGEVLALSNLPDYNPNSRENLDNIFNSVTQGVYEPGSIFKVFTLGICLELKLCNINSEYDVSLPILKNGEMIQDYTYIDHKIILPEVFMFSSNVGTSLIVEKIGKNNMINYLNKLNLLADNTLEIIEKENAIYPKLNNDHSLMTLSYGHGIALTQANMVNGLLALINEGYYIPLTIFKINDKSKILPKKIFSNETSRVFRAISRLVVAKGSGKYADVEGYNVAGKTGSAEKQIQGVYNADKVFSSFIGFFPAENPKYIVIVSIDEPKRLKFNNYNITGGIVAAKAVNGIIKDLTQTLGLEKNKDKAKDINQNSRQEIIDFINNFNHNK